MTCGKGDMKGPPLELYMKKEEMDSQMGTESQDDGDSMQAQGGESDASDAPSSLEIDEWPEDDPSDNEAARIKEEDDRIGNLLPHLFAPGWDAFLTSTPTPSVPKIIKDKPKARPKPKASSSPSSSSAKAMKVTAMKVVKMQMKAH